MHFDCLILGGGPAASTVGSLLRRYRPDLSVMIVEREKFPRDHIGESMLPIMMSVLGEMGVYDKVEAQNFPIKVGSTYRWGISKDLWTLSFLDEPLTDAPRPLPLEGQRFSVSFHVDRSIYDKLLLEHAEELGCEVHQQAKAVHIEKEGDKVVAVDVAFTQEDGSEKIERITAKYFVDATGATSTLRKAMGVEAEYPTNLRNIAVWDYWQDAKWAETLGVGGPRVQIMSVDWGWLWFIPITATRTSIGLVTHAEYYKKSGKSTEELYTQAIAQDPIVSELTREATRENHLRATKDWSYVAERLTGDNWFLAGDAAGFADPILSAGLTLAQVSARKVAYTILELEKGLHDEKWLKEEYSRTHRFNVLQHHRFAQFWYASNGCSKDLKEYCAEIAADAGITLGREAAFRWMATGGFTAGNTPDVRGTGFGMTGVSAIAGKIYGEETTWKIKQANVFKLNLEGAREDVIAVYKNGGIAPTKCYRRGDSELPMTFANSFVINALKTEEDGVCLYHRFSTAIKQLGQPEKALFYALEAMEAMVLEGWITAEVDESRPMMDFEQLKMFQ
jgi:flavin-dependent dehydrogenase